MPAKLHIHRHQGVELITEGIKLFRSVDECDICPARQRHQSPLWCAGEVIYTHSFRAHDPETNGINILITQPKGAGSRWLFSQVDRFSVRQSRPTRQFSPDHKEPLGR